MGSAVFRGLGFGASALYFRLCACLGEWENVEAVARAEGVGVLDDQLVVFLGGRALIDESLRALVIAKSRMVAWLPGMAAKAAMVS